MQPDLQATYELIAGQMASPEPQCVLVLGPELSVDQQGRSYRQRFRNIVGNLKNSRSRYVATDNLFYFHDDFDSDTIKNEIVKFYRDVGDKNLLELISRLPVPLVINVCPDKSLNALFRQKGLPFEEAYFSISSRSKFQDLPVPSVERPVLYNIFGSIDWDPSVILTHPQLYEAMEHLLPEKSLPDNIERFINDSATSFIFLGFQFESWYYQLICHKLLGKQFRKKPIKLSTPFFREEENVAIIMNGSFGMRFTADSPLEFIRSLTDVIGREYPDALRAKSALSQWSTFVSYARNNNPDEPDREAIVDLLQDYFTHQQDSLIQFFRDRDDLGFGDSIDSFMHRIGTGKTVIMVVSDKYLRSYYCMMEALRVFRHRDTEQRLFIVVLEDARVGDANAKQAYKDFWYGRCRELLENPGGLDNGRFEEYGQIYRFIEPFLDTLADTVYLGLRYNDLLPAEESDQPEPLLRVVNERREEVRLFLETIIRKLKE